MTYIIWTWTTAGYKLFDIHYLNINHCWTYFILLNMNHELQLDMDYFGLITFDVYEIYTIKYSHIYTFSLTFMLFCDWLYNIFLLQVTRTLHEMGLGQLNQANLHPARHEFKRRPTQLNLSPIGARNQRKFASNPSPIRIRIPACTLVSIFGITFGSDVQSRWFKLGWKVNLKGYNFVVYQKSEFRHLNGPKTSVKWSLKI